MWFRVIGIRRCVRALGEMRWHRRVFIMMFCFVFLPLTLAVQHLRSYTVIINDMYTAYYKFSRPHLTRNLKHELSVIGGTVLCRFPTKRHQTTLQLTTCP